MQNAEMEGVFHSILCLSKKGMVIKMKPKIFIDGRDGTTGLQIYDRLNGRDDIELLLIDESNPEDAIERKKLINKADLVFLCLPDEIALESVSFIENDNTCVIDASTAHRVASGWVYGLPELSESQRECLRAAKRVSNPGCHSTGAILLLKPLVETGVIPPDHPLTITSVTGYTGGGMKMINEYEEADREECSELNAPRLYSTGASHKHIPEIMRYTGITAAPVFMPLVADYPQGMQVIIPLHLPDRRREVIEAITENYAGCLNIDVLVDSPVFAASNFNANTDKVTLRILGFDDKIILTAQFDNLGKGASGAAVQNMNIMLGFNEYERLRL